MGARKIVNESEVIRWFEEGRTQRWMSEEYARKYNIQTSPTLFANFRTRRGLPRRIARDVDLIPWHVLAQHRNHYDVAMLRAEGRRRAGLPLAEGQAARLEAWLKKINEANVVIHYDPDTAQGFWQVPARKGEDLIRRPKRLTTLRRSAD